MSNATPYETRCQILGELWEKFQRDPDYEEFFEHFNLGLPLAYFISIKLVESSTEISGLVDETFEGLLTAFDIEEDIGFEDLESVLGYEFED